MRDAAREWAQRADLPRRERLDSLDRFETFFRNVGGLAEPSAPLGVRRADGAGAAPSVAMPFGRFVRSAPPAQTWDGNRLDFGTPTEDSGWSAHSPATGTTKRINVPEEDAYWDLAMFVPVTHTTHRVADFALKVDGQTVKTWTDVLVSGNGLWLHRQLGVQELNSAITLEHIGGDPIGIAAGGEASMQLVDRQVGEVFEPSAGAPSDPYFWYRPDTLSAGSLTGWADEGSVEWDLAVPSGATAPTVVAAGLNGLPYVEFDGSSNALRLSDPSAPRTGNWVVAIVGRLRSLPTCNLFSSGGGATTYDNFRHHTAALGQLGYGQFDTLRGPGTEVEAGEWFVAVLELASDKERLWVDGVVGAEQDRNLNGFAGLTVGAGRGTSSTDVLGHAPLDLAELVGWRNTVPTPGQAYDYLAAKWGL